MNLKIISSSEQLFESKEVINILVPGSDGEFGILQDHLPLIARLQIGSIKIVLKDKSEQEVLINGGLVQVQNNEVLILADEASLPDKLISEEIETAIEKAQTKMASEELEPSELIQLEKQLRYERFKRDKIIK